MSPNGDSAPCTWVLSSVTGCSPSGDRARWGRHPCCVRRPPVLLAITGAESIPPVVLRPAAPGGRADGPPGHHSGPSGRDPLNRPAGAGDAAGRRRRVVGRRAAHYGGAMPSTLDWLRARDDRALVALLRARPDLTVPAPGDLTVLAGRLNTGPSVWRAMESLNQFHIQVLQGAGRARRREARRRPRRPAATARRRGPGRPRWTRRWTSWRASRWSAGPTQIHMPSAVLAVLGPYPAGLGSPGTRPSTRPTAAVAGLDPAARGHARSAGHRGPAGHHRLPVHDRQGGHHADRRRPAAPGGPGDRRAAAGGRPGAARRRAARSDPGRAAQRTRPSSTASPTVDGTGGGQALATVDRLGRLLDAIGQNPPPALKSGGLGIRELRRLAKAMGTDEPIDRAGRRGAGRVRADRRRRLPGPDGRILDADGRGRRLPGRPRRGGLGAGRRGLAGPAAQPVPGGHPGRRRTRC